MARLSGATGTPGLAGVMDA